MGKIIETSYHDTVDKIIGFNNTLINNSFYSLNDKRPVIVTYYNINKEASTLDPGSKLTYDNIGKDTPIRFNKIDDFIIYGFNKIELNTENEEFGLESDKITGECYILPNTITPYENDYFEVEHIKDSSWLFMITDVQQDTLENGSNVFKVTYRLEYPDHDRLLSQVVGNYRMIEKREGTNVVKIVENTKYDKARRIDDICVALKHYYYELFYNTGVQTFTFMDLTEWRVYDPFLIEFLIRNKILDDGSDSYIYVCHQLDIPRTFSLDYDKTLYKAFEKKSIKDLAKSNRNIQVKDIRAYGTTFYSRYEAYFEAVYVEPAIRGYYGCTLSDDIVYAIRDNQLVDDTIRDLNHKNPLWVNILVKYFNGGEYTEDEIESVLNMKFDTSIMAFYIIPLIILCLEDTIETMLR